MFERFTEPGIKVVVTAQEEARKIGNNFVGTEQILLGLIAETSGIGGRILRKYGVTLKLAREEIKRLVGRGSGFVAVEIPFTPRARRVLENAIEESKTLGFPYVGPEHILLGVLMEDSGIAITALRKILRDVNPDITFEIIRQRTLREMGEEYEEDFGRDSSRNKKASRKSKSNEFDNKPQTDESGEMMQDTDEKMGDWENKDIHPWFDPRLPLLLSPVVNEYTQNITQMAFRGDIDPVIGRVNEVERVLQILSRRRKNNPILLGEPGVGKTAVAEGLALEIIGGYVPMILQGKNVITLDLGLIIAGSRYRGDFEKRLKRVISDIQLTRVYILVIDEVHTLVGAGAAEGSLDAANILKPALARGTFQCIGATTLSEYRKYIEPDAALARRFQSVMVKEPSVDDTIKILNGIRDKYEKHHHVRISHNAIEDAAVLSSRYINDRFLPDKAIDIIDESCSRVRVGYEMIPDMCQIFEDQITSVCREKDAAYKDKDWLTALSVLREEILAVQMFLEFLYGLFDKYVAAKKFWILRSMQQRYQLTLRGIGPILKEWDIVFEIYENQKLIDKLETEIEDKNSKKKNTNSSESKKTKLISSKVKTAEELEQKLANYRDNIKNQPLENFMQKAPLDKDGNPIEDGNQEENNNPEFGEEGRFVDQELDNIQEEIKNMKDGDQLEELKKKFDESSLSMSQQSKTESAMDNEQLESMLGERFDKSKGSSNEDNDLVNNEATVSLLNRVNSSAGALKFKEILSEYKIPFDEQNIPPEVAEAVQKKLFTDLFTPFTPIVDRASALDNFLEEDKELNEVLSIKTLLSEDDEDKKFDLEVQNLEQFLKRRKLWCLFSFITWNPFLLKRNFENSGEIITEEKSEKFSKPKYYKELVIGKSQVGVELFSLYRKQRVFVKLNKLNFTSALAWRDLFHESLIEGIGNMLIQRFGYGSGKSNINSLTSKQKALLQDSSSSKNKESDLELSDGAKEFIEKNPDWLTMDPKNFKDVSLTDSNKIALSEKYGINPDDLLPDEQPENVDEYKRIKNTQKTTMTEKGSLLLKENLEEISNHLSRSTNKPVSKTYIPWVLSSDIAGVVSEWTGIPVAKVSKNETKKLLNIEAELQRRVIGQPDAVKAIAKALRRGRVGLRDSTRPIASFFFSGPTGVGKTEVTKALAASYFGGEADMIRFDMSEFMERHTVSKLIGSPPGYVGYSEGGQLTESVRRKPYVVILFDEVEKAHPDVFNLLLQVLEDGRLSDSQGRIVDFKNTIIVMTSNLGASAIQNPEKFKLNKSEKNDVKDIIKDTDLLEDSDSDSEGAKIKELVYEELKNFFRPEFLNRIDEIVVFRKLTKPDIKEIASIMLSGLKGRLLSKKYHLLISEDTIEQIIEEGFNPDYGARPLRRVITNRLEDNLAASILEKDIEPGSTIWVDYRDGEYSINHKNFSKSADASADFGSNNSEKNEKRPRKVDELLRSYNPS